MRLRTFGATNKTVLTIEECLMNRMTQLRNAILVTVITLLAVLPLGAFADHGHNIRSLSGSWEATIDFFGTPVRAMFSFFPNGVVLESDNPAIDPNFGNLAFSNGHGKWTRVRRNQFEFKYQKFAYD